MNEKRKNNYPSTRRPRNVSYSKSYKLLHAVGEETLKEMFKKAGMYTVAAQLSEMLGQQITPAVARYTRTRYKLGRTNETNCI